MVETLRQAGRGEDARHVVAIGGDEGRGPVGLSGFRPV